MNPGKFFAELKRRNVYKIAAAYCVAAWLIIQVATQVFPFFVIPNWAVQLVVLLLVLGFPVTLALTWAFEITPGGSRREEGAPNDTRKKGRMLTAAIVFLAAVAVGVMFVRILPAPTGQDSPSAPAIPIDGKAIAVLPFQNLSSDEANSYFVSGIRDEILTSLAQVNGLVVRSRTSTQKYKSHPEDLAALVRELGVVTVLEGSVRKINDDVLINVQLIDARNGRQLWAEGYRRTVKDVFTVQGEVAQRVAAALQIELAPAQTRRLQAPPTTNARAHDLYLRGHALGAHSDEESLEKKIELLQEAVKEDPHYAMAWGDLAGAYLTIADAYRAPLEVLGPNSSDAHRWLGWYRARVEGDFAAGRAEVQRARALDPSYTWPLMFESLIALARCDYEAALQLAEQVMEVDPQFFYDVDPIANVYSAMGRWGDAVKRYELLPVATLKRPNFQTRDLLCAHRPERPGARDPYRPGGAFPATLRGPGALGRDLRRIGREG